MPNIYRFLIKTLCVFGVTCFLLKTNANAFDDWCHCTAFNKCSLQDVTTSQWYTHAQICRDAFPGVTFYCDASHQKNFVEDINNLTCSGGKYVDSGTDCGCRTQWEEVDDTPGEWTDCYGHKFCKGNLTAKTTFGIQIAEGNNTCYNYKRDYVTCAKNMYEYVDLKCDTAKKYYYVNELSYEAYEHDIKSGDCPEQRYVMLTKCTGCSEKPCNDTSEEWKNCSDSDMDCFGGNPGSYDPSLYERQVGYTFDASANNGNGSCTWQIKGLGWRCKKGYYPTDIKTYAESDLQREPNFRCTPCPVGYISAEYNDKTQTWLHDTSFDYDLGASSGDIHSCKKCPAAFTTDTPNPSKGLINDSIQKCYIDTNVKLSDSLGKITLSEEIGSGTKLYHQ